jgi:hypothetical protein
VETTGLGWALQTAGRGGRKSREERERGGVGGSGAPGSWFAAAPGLRDGEGLLYFAARAAAAAGASTGASFSAF